MKNARIGHGYDIHRLVAGRPLILAGVRIEHETGLEGHSDADVVCHALSDAILGALAKGDIGAHFPPSDPKWKDANSLEILRQVWSMAAAESGRLVNADVTIVAEAPKLAPHVGRMRANLAEALGVAKEQISVKATTNEGLGPEGRREGISATALCLIEFKNA